jgi:dipeptidyl aminopeptidase/acylaminoacyl peptidase
MFPKRMSVLWIGVLLAASTLLAQDIPPSIVADGVPPIPAELRARMNQYLNMRVAVFADWHPRERAMLILTRFGDTAQVHMLRAPGAYRQQLTFFPDRVLDAKFSPAAQKDYFLFSMDTGGGEAYQIHRFDLADGSIRMLTDGKSRNEGMLFNHRGTQAAYVSQRRNGRDFDLYLVDPLNPATEKLAAELKGQWVPLDWSQDDSRLLLMEYISVNETYLHMIEPSSGRVDLLTGKGTEKIAYGTARWAADGKGLFVVSDRGSEFQRLFYYDLAAKSFTSLTEHIPWDVEEIERSPDGRTLAFTVNADGISELRLLDVRTRRERATPKLPRGQIFNIKFHPQRGELAFNLNSAKSPSDVYSCDLKTGKIERWTYSETGGLNAETFQEIDLIHFPTFDAVEGKPRMLAAFVTKPPAKFQPPYPVLIDIHGGPEGQSRPGFRGRYNYFINEMGIALIEPNVRGSTGYGKSFTQLDNGYQREDTVKDIGALLDWVAQQPGLDVARVAVMGGSYGGYMSLASMTHFGDRLRCGIDIVGISNFVTFLESTKDYRRDLRRVEYGDERDPKMREFLIRISPLTNADKIRKPLLVAQGQNDPRVPVGESEQMVQKVKSSGGAVWYILAKDEGHGFAKKPNADYVYQAVAMFLDEFLLK